MCDLKTTRLKWDNLQLNLNFLAATKPDVVRFTSEFNSFTFKSQISDIDINEQVVFHPEFNRDWLAHKYLPNLLFS